MTDDAAEILDALVNSTAEFVPQIQSEVLAEWLDRDLPTAPSSDQETLRQQFGAALDVIEVKLGEHLLILAYLFRWSGGDSFEQDAPGFGELRFVGPTYTGDGDSDEVVLNGDINPDRLAEAGHGILRLVETLRGDQGLPRAEGEDDS